ncbi:MAG: radical SAM protein [Actinomycetota bacterium]
MNAMPALVADIVRSSFVDGPGNRYVVFFQGCTFNCLACHNPHTIGVHPTADTRQMSVSEIVADVAESAPFISGVTVSGGEATCQSTVVAELFAQLAGDPRTAHLTRLVDSNGDADRVVWESLAPGMHGAMIDLKAFDDDVHQLLTGRSNQRVLQSLRCLDELDRLAEIRLLVVPGLNDDAEMLARTARWIGELASTPRIRVIAFRHAGTRPIARRLREATSADIEAVVTVLVAQGIDRARIAASVS